MALLSFAPAEAQPSPRHKSMNHDPLDSLAQLEADLWQAADNLRANS
jgi:hypothetical protein